MIAEQVSHDVLAAAVAGVALIVVATIPLLWKRISDSRGVHADITRQLAEVLEILRRRQDG